MKRLLFVAFLLCCCAMGTAQRVDTLYYDSDWKRIDLAQLASYTRYAAYYDDGEHPNTFKTIFRNGEIEGEGEFVRLDTIDDTNSAFGPHKRYYKDGALHVVSTIKDGNGIFTSYYPNGNKKETFGFKNHMLDGESYDYFENGLIRIKSIYQDDELQGIAYVFSEDGHSCKQYEYDHGQLSKPYYLLTTSQGYSSKYDIETNQLYLETPKPEDLHHDGQGTYFYMMNGISAVLSIAVAKDYGKYFRINVAITNNTPEPIPFDPSKIMVFSEDNKGGRKFLMTWSADTYVKKIGYHQMADQYWYNAAQTYAANTAGYSTQRADYVAAATDGLNVAVFGGTVISTQYNPQVAYQAALIANQNMSSYNQMLINERNIKSAGYLKPTTIMPGETMTGYIYTDFDKKMVNLNITIPINKIKYVF